MCMINLGSKSARMPCGKGYERAGARSLNESFHKYSYFKISDISVGVV